MDAPTALTRPADTATQPPGSSRRWSSTVTTMSAPRTSRSTGAGMRRAVMAAGSNARSNTGSYRTGRNRIVLTYRRPLPVATA